MMGRIAILSSPRGCAAKKGGIPVDILVEESIGGGPRIPRM